MSGRSHAPRVPAIDGLRAVAILIVMAAHALPGGIVPGGFGVSVFFFLSGYLITTLMRVERQRTGTVNLPAFYARRVARILPPLYMTMALVAFLIAAGAIRHELSAIGIAADLAFLTNYGFLLGAPEGMPIPLWSLDIEEHFYLVFPLMFIGLGWLRPKLTPILLLASCVLVLLVRVYVFSRSGGPGIYYWSHTRIDAILWGTILAVWSNPALDEDAWSPPLHAIALAVGALLVSFVVRDPFFRETLRYTVQGAALFVLFSAAVQSTGPVRAVLDSKPLKTVALMSYTLYLVHEPMLMPFWRYGQVAAVMLGYPLAFGWAWLIYYYVERPVANWRKRSLSSQLRRRAGEERFQVRATGL